MTETETVAGAPSAESPESPGHTRGNAAAIPAPGERATLASLVGLLVIGLSDNQLIAPILPSLASDLGTGISQVGATVSAYSIAAALAALSFGPRSDRHGRRPYLIGAGAVFALGSLMAATSSNLINFVAARCLVGAAAGIISALVVAAIADLVPYSRRGKAMSWVAVAYFAAPVLIVPLAAALSGRFGWRVNYYGLALVAVIGTYVLSLLFRDERTRPIETPRDSDASEPGDALALAGANYVSFLTQIPLLAGAVSAFFVSGGFVGFTLYLGAYLTESFGYGVESVALVFALCGAFGVLGALGAGRLADRLGKRSVAIVASLALSGLLAVTPFVSGFGLYLALALVGLAAVSRVAPLQSLVTELVSPTQRAAYVALRNTLSQLGIGGAALIGAWIYPMGFQWICLMAALFSAIAAMLLFFIREPTSEASA